MPVPSFSRGVAALRLNKKIPFLTGADGVVRNFKQNETFRLANHPVCIANEATRHFIDAAATPPVSGGEFAASDSVEQHARKRNGPQPHLTQRNGI